MSNILDAIRKHQLKTYAAKERYQTLSENRVAQHINVLKQLDYTEEDFDTRELYAQAVFHRLYDDYYQKRTITLPTLPSKRVTSFWKRVVACADKAKVDVEVYLRAQFSYFHHKFRTVPKYEQLATENAILRAQEYQVTERSRIIGTSVKADIDYAKLLAAANKHLLDIQRAQNMTREEVYRDLVLPGHVYVPQVFLDTDPLWKSVVNEREQ